MMRFLFFNAAGTVLFKRSDAESASVTHEEMSFQAVFPYDKAKEILRGMRIGYEDAAGSYQVFEVRKVRTLEPDHYQEITAENIAISELTDEFTEKKEITNKTVAQVLPSLLTNTGWAVGTNTTANQSSCDISTGDVWSATRTIQQNWNVYIIPRITVNSTGITHKYLDVMPAEGTWRGFRLSLDKNANEVGVIWDDSKLKTALYGFGQEKNGTPLTFKNVVWTTSGGDPANKPANQTYVEDASATSNYGRNGRPRFGYYQNASITDAATLLEKTWEVLQTVSIPDVTVSASVTDLHRLGYVDVPLRLHDTALVEVRPTGVVLQKEIVQYTEDLLDPLQSRLTIGTYIPNIIYINRENNRRSGGGRGSGSSQTLQEYTTENNTVQINIDSNGLNSLCVGTGAQLNPDGSLVVDEYGNPVFIDGGSNMYSKITQNSSEISTVVSKTGINSLGQSETLYSKIEQNAAAITLKVSQGEVATQLSVECGNVTISGGDLVVDGYVTTDGLEAAISNIDNLYVENVTAEGDISCDNFTSTTGDIDTLSCVTLDINGVDMDNAVIGFGTVTSSGGQITIPYSTVDGTGGNITFNIADTAYYQSHIGISSTGSWVWDSNESDYVREITPNAGSPAYVTLPSITVNANTGTNQSFAVYAYGPSSGGTVHDVSLAKSFYLQSDTDYVYVTNNSSTPTVGTNVVARIANPGSGQAGIASITDAGWTYSNNAYRNTVTATANDGTTASTAVTLPSITCDANRGTSASVTVQAYGPTVLGDQYSISNSGKTFYLKSDNDYVYLTNTNSTPTVGTNVVARAANAAQGGIASVALNAHSNDVSDWNDWTYSASASLSDKYALIKATANNGSSYYFGLNASGVYNAGYNAAPVGIASIARTNYTNDASTYNGWSTNHSSVSMSSKYLLYTATGNDGTTRTIKINASSTYQAGYDAAPVGVASIARTDYTNDSSVYTNWSTNYSSVSNTYKYLLYTATGNDGTTKTIKINAASTYTAGRNAPTIDNFDLNGYSASTSSTQPTTALSKSTTTISGYKWFQLADGTWKNLGAFSISTGATRATSLYSRIWDEDEGAYIYQQLPANKLYYRT